jgi:predicted RNA-binding Zn-ribbon protein involved in translation (DUF1610 family)
VRENIKEEKMEEQDNLIYEWCQHCDSEVRILADRPSPCPECGVVILPCSFCDMNLLNGCNWNEETRCLKFPKEEK